MKSLLKLTVITVAFAFPRYQSLAACLEPAENIQSENYIAKTLNGSDLIGLFRVVKMEPKTRVTSSAYTQKIMFQSVKLLKGKIESHVHEYGGLENGSDGPFSIGKTYFVAFPMSDARGLSSNSGCESFYVIQPNAAESTYKVFEALNKLRH